LRIEEIPGLGRLSKADARAAEQALIEHHGLARDGGTLLNRINTIAKTSSRYGQWLQRGIDLLTQAGYLGF
jgi:hypothetical protein